MRQQGHAVHGAWFRARMSKAVHALYGDHLNFKASKG
jgi:hypothetical protein